VPDSRETQFNIIDNTPEQIAPWLVALWVRFWAQIQAGHKVALCLEQPAGGLLYHFLNSQWLERCMPSIPCLWRAS
jgi:hypothetical protein